MLKCKNCGQKIKKSKRKYINKKIVCDYCFGNIKFKNKQKEKRSKRRKRTPKTIK